MMYRFYTLNRLFLLRGCFKYIYEFVAFVFADTFRSYTNERQRINSEEDD